MHERLKVNLWMNLVIGDTLTSAELINHHNDILIYYHCIYFHWINAFQAFLMAFTFIFGFLDSVLVLDIVS